MRNKKRQAFHKKIRKKKAEIVKYGNVVDITDEEIHEVMKRYDFQNYTIEVWGDVNITTPSGRWRVIFEEKYIELQHMNSNISRKGNYRSSYHIQNVYYDYDFCIKSIKEHDLYKVIGVKSYLR